MPLLARPLFALVSTKISPKEPEYRQEDAVWMIKQNSSLSEQSS